MLRSSDLETRNVEVLTMYFSGSSEAFFLCASDHREDALIFISVIY